SGHDTVTQGSGVPQPWALGRNPFGVVGCSQIVSKARDVSRMIRDYPATCASPPPARVLPAARPDSISLETGSATAEYQCRPRHLLSLRKPSHRVLSAPPFRRSLSAFRLTQLPGRRSR